MHVMAVADDFSSDFVGLEDGACKSWRAMLERRHAIEQMCRLPRAGGNCRERFLVRRVRMPERHVVAARRQPAHEIQPSIELRRDRHDSDVRRRALDLAEDVAGIEIVARRRTRP